MLYFIVSQLSRVIHYMPHRGPWQMNVFRPKPHPGIRLIAAALPLSLKPHFVAATLTGAATRDTWMHTDSALHVVASSFVSDYGTWFCFFRPSSCVFLAVSLCAWSVLTAWVWLSQGGAVSSMSAWRLSLPHWCPHQGKTFPLNRWTHPEPFLHQTRFPFSVWLLFRMHQELAAKR